MSTDDYGILSRIYRRFILQPLGLNTDNSLVLWLILIFGGITISSLWYFQGDILVVLSLLYVCGIFLLSFLRIDYSLYVLIAAVLIFDQFGNPGGSTFTYQASFFSDLREIPYLPPIDLGMINPVEIHLVFIIFSVLFLLAVKKDFTWRPIPVYIPFTILALLFTGAFINGISHGGNIGEALWEIRAFIYFFLLYLLVPQIIRTRRQIYFLTWIFIIAISFKAIQAAVRFAELGFTVSEPAALINREGPVFVISLLMLLFGFLAFNIKIKQRLCLVVMIPVLLFGFYLGWQWGALVILLVSLITFFVLLPSSAHVRVMKYSFPIVAAFAFYVMFHWSSSGPLGQPVQVLKSSFEHTQREAGYQSYLTTLYHEVRDTKGAQPGLSRSLIGVGFGKENEQTVSTRMSRPQNDQITNHGFFWLLVKMGIVGFLAFWLFFNAFIAKAVKVLQRLSDTYLKIILIVIIVTIINQMVVAYLDLQLTYYRNMIYLACLMGLLSAVEQYTNTDVKTDYLIEGS